MSNDAGTAAFAGLPGSIAERQIILLKPRGFCAGVVRAIDIVNIALELYGAPIYVRKEIVHNFQVVADLSRKGAISSTPPTRFPRARASFSAPTEFLRASAKNDRAAFESD